MPATGFQLPAARAVEAGSGAWANDINILDEGGTVATFTLTLKNTTGRWLAGQNFGFDSLVPLGATIDAVEIKTNYQVGTTGGIANPEIQAFVGGVEVGSVNALDPAEPLTLTPNTFDITADRAWTRADLLDGTFEVKVRGRNGNNATNPSYQFDYVQAQVTYTEAGPTDFPQVAAETSSSTETASTSHTVSMPTGTGGRLLMALSFVDNPTLSGTDLSAWTKLGATIGDNIPDETLHVYYRDTDPAGGTISVTSSTSVRSAHHVWRISGADGSTAPEIAGTSATSTTNPPSLNPSAWDVEDTLWVALVSTCNDGAASVISGFPASYTNGGSRVTAGTAADGVGLGWARRELAAASDDPAAFTGTFPGRACAATVAIRPGTAVTTVEGTAAGTYTYSSSAAGLAYIGLTANPTEDSDRIPSCLCLPGQPFALATTPDHTSLDVLGDIELGIDLAAFDWSPTAVQSLVCKATSGIWSYQLALRTNGALRITWSADGSSTLALESDANLAALASLERRAVVVLFDANNGTGRTARFYTAPSREGPWTQFGTDRTAAGTTSIANTNRPLEIGGRNSAQQEPFQGRIFSTWVRDGIGGGTVGQPGLGTLVFDARFIDRSDGSGSFTEETGKTVTLFGGARINGLASGTVTPLAGAMAATEDDEMLAASGTVSTATPGGTGAYSYTGAAAGQITVNGTGAGTYTYSGTAAGVASPSTALGAAAGAYTYTGTGAGEGAPSTVNGTGAGAYTYTGVGIGEGGPATVNGTATGNYTTTRTAAGAASASTFQGTVTAAFDYSGAAAGTATPAVFTGAATGVYMYAGVMVAPPAVPDSGWPVTLVDATQTVTLIDPTQDVMLVDPDSTVSLVDATQNLVLSDSDNAVAVTDPDQTLVF